ncbi:site-specific integrase [Frankia sp. BMG5.11]|uniref:integrase n=1 Tax=Parafrankia sp. BMG5.11 TaxID=222540 RepID=UPI001A9F8DA1
MPRLTKASVEAVSVPASSPVLSWDDQIPGFAIKVLPSGTRKYVLKYRTAGGRGGRQRWLGLGTHGAITVDQARKLAKQAAAAVARGEDPQQERRSRGAEPRLIDLWERFAADHLGLKKPGTRADYCSIWANAIGPAFASHIVGDLSRAEVDKFHKAMRATPYQANRTLALLSRLLNLAEAWGWRNQGTNPCKHVTRFSERQRQRFLSAAEISRLFEALDALESRSEITGHLANLVRLLLLTGARSGELRIARWDWVQWDRKVIALPDSKTGAKPIYLNDEALAILQEQHAQSGRGDMIFAGRTTGSPIVNLRKPWLKVCSEAGLEGVRIHDLRHTAASVAIGAGATLAVVGRLLGHTQAQTTLRYAHLDSDPALKGANLIGSQIGALRRPTTGKPSGINDIEAQTEDDGLVG